MKFFFTKSYSDNSDSSFFSWGQLTLCAPRAATPLTIVWPMALWFAVQSAAHTSQHARAVDQSLARQQQLDQRRVLHLSSEKKRRNTIKVCSLPQNWIVNSLDHFKKTLSVLNICVFVFMLVFSRFSQCYVVFLKFQSFYGFFKFCIITIFLFSLFLISFKNIEVFLVYAPDLTDSLSVLSANSLLHCIVYE